ncbi:hypothetical protein M405DRAFT_434013 [Rhizopogon salebrosus TDB-379]|nr:hypothetical protein M405DRAFT_434013 [Rhizopogon salebrosus TDB-379]
MLRFRAVCFTDAHGQKAYSRSDIPTDSPAPMQFGDPTFIMTHSPNVLPLNTMSPWPWPYPTGSCCIADGGCKSAGSESVVGSTTWSNLVTACLLVT